MLALPFQEKGEKSCERAGEAILDHIAHMSDMIEVANGAERPAEEAGKAALNHIAHYMSDMVTIRSSANSTRLL